MDFILPDTVEQRAIELVSSLGKEHLFVASCPSDIDADKYAGTVITYEEAFDHSDAGVGLCLLLPKPFVLRKFVDHSIEKNISVHLSSRVQVVLMSLRLLLGYTTCCKIKFNMLASCKTLESRIVPRVTKKNFSLRARLNPMQIIAKFPGLSLVELWSTYFPELLLSIATLSSNCRPYLW